MDDLDIARRAAAAAAEVIAAHAGRPRHTDYKAPVNPVTEADREAEAVIVGIIRANAPDDGILGEEGADTTSASGRRWVVDPLDGTVNFVHGIPQVAVSIALEDSDGAAIGVVRDVFREEEYVATRGGGAFRDGEPIRVSGCSELTDAMVSTGFSYDRHERAADYGRHVGTVLAHVQGIRRLGSAALDLAWVACGRHDGHWEIALSPWDVAAGFLIVREAGGVVTDPEGGEPSHRAFVAATPAIHEALRVVVAGALAG